MIGNGNKRRTTAFACILILLLCLLTGCGAQRGEAITSLEQLGEAGRKIGVALNCPEEAQLPLDFPRAKIIPYPDALSAYADVANGRLDALVYARRPMELAIENGTTGVRLLDVTYSTNTVGVGISPVTPIPDFTEKLNAFIAACKADGTLDDMYERWVLQGNETMPEIRQAEHPSLHLRVATVGTLAPYTYYAGAELCGYDIELAERFAAWLDADLEFKVYDFPGTVAAALSGDVDCIMSNLYYTPEHDESIPFSDPLFEVENTVMVRDTSAPAAEAATVRWQDYNGKRLGVLVGPLMEDAAAAFFPDSEYLYFDSYPDCATALLTGKIDGFLGDEPGMISMHAEQPKIDYIHEALTENNYAFAFRKDDPESAALCAELNAFLARSWADGTMNELEEIWLGVDEARKTVDMSDLTGENGTIRVATTSTDMPWSYIKDGKNVGYDIDLVVRFCRDRGYALELGDMDFAGRIPAVQSGKYDFSTDMNVTAERQEQVLFSDPTSHGGIVLAVRASDLAAVQRTAAEVGVYQSMDALEGKRIGVMTGSIQDAQVAERLPDSERLYFNAMPDMLVALRANKIDAFACPEALVRYMMTEAPDLACLDETLGNGVQIGAVFPKTEAGQALCEQFNAFVREIRSSGVYEEILNTWFGSDESKRVIEPLDTLPGPNGVLRMAVEAAVPPFVYIKNGEPAGIDVDMVVRFCREYGYGLEMISMDFTAVLPSVATGKADFSCCGIAYTPERAESVLFSETYYESRTVMAVLDRAGDGQTQQSAPAALSDRERGGSFFASVRDSFEKTFLRENRWKLFVSGIGTTMLITVLSIVLGTALGFGVFLLCRSGNPAADRITRFFIWLLQGMPMVVLLMILYYIIFGKVAISGTAVAVIGFTLVFGAAVFGMLKSGVGAVDRGQTEAAYALGYTDRRAFFRIILPQALPHFFPAYKGEITATIKATAIVGYVAVQDLTKMGDIVRSRTYEAFFPLIAVAVIYFILAAILTAVVNRLGDCIDPRRRKREDILKGVKVK